MSSIHFDPFEEMFVPPIHDGTKSVIDLDFTSSQLIQRHEWVHGQIFTSLPDGQLLAALLYLDNVDLTPLGISRKRQGELKDALINASRRAHEAAATYLSIKMEVPEAQKNLITSLDLDYRKYYSIFADILDNKIGSSYIQYLVAWNTVRVCFSSRYLERFSANPIGTGLYPETDEQPNARLVAILDPLRMHVDSLLEIINHRFRELCEQHSVAYWDPHEESGWVTLHEQAPMILDDIEAQLSLVLQPFLIEISELPTLLYDDHRRAYKTLSGWLRLAGAEFGKMTDYDPRAHNASKVRAIDAYNQSLSEVRVSGAGSIVQKPGVENWSLVDRYASFLFIEDEGNANGPWTDRASFTARFKANKVDEWLRTSTADCLWNGFAWYGEPYRGEFSWASSLTQGQLLRWLNVRSQSKLEMTSEVVLVTRPCNFLHLMTYQRLLYDCLSIDRGRWEPGKIVLPLCHYLKGNWFDWFENLRTLRDEFSPMGPWKLIFGEIQLRPHSAGSLVLYVLWHGVYGASFFHLSSPHAAKRMQPGIIRLVEQRYVKIMDTDEARIFRSLYEKIIIPHILKCWSSL